MSAAIPAVDEVESRRDRRAADFPAALALCYTGLIAAQDRLLAMPESADSAARHGASAAPSARPDPLQPSAAAPVVVPPLWVQSSLAEAARRFGALDLAPEVFAREAAARLAPGEPQDASSPHRVMAAAIADAQGADLALALACERQLPRAWEVLVQDYQPRLLAVLRSRHIPVAEAEDLVADLWGELALPPPDGGTRTRIGTYRGVSSLFSWLCVILIRRGIDRHRDRRLQREDGEHGAAAVAGAAPAVARGKSPLEAAQYAEEALQLRSALIIAWRELPHREALAMTFRYRENLPLAPIACVLDVGVARVSRILARAERRLAEALRAALRQQGRPGAGSPRGSGSPWQQVLGVFLANLSSPADLPGCERKDPR